MSDRAASPPHTVVVTSLSLPDVPRGTEGTTDQVTGDRSRRRATLRDDARSGGMRCVAARPGDHGLGMAAPGAIPSPPGPRCGHRCSGHGRRPHGLRALRAGHNGGGTDGRGSQRRPGGSAKEGYGTGSGQARIAHGNSIEGGWADSLMARRCFQW